MNLETETRILTKACQHCGLEMARSVQSDFCCNACETVYQVIHNPKFKSEYEFWNGKAAQQVQLYIEGIHCASCVTLLEKIPVVLPNIVQESTLDYAHSVLNLKLREPQSLATVAELIRTWGYQPQFIDEKNKVIAFQKNENKKALVQLGVAGALAGNIMLFSIPLYSGVSGHFEVLFEWLSFALAIPSLFYSGRSFLQNTVRAIQTKTFSIDAPIALAMLAAFVYSVFSLLRGTHDLYFDSLSGLVFLLLTSRYLLSRIKQSSKFSLDFLDFLQEELNYSVGQKLQLTPNTKIQFDAKIVQGKVWVDASRFSGESEPLLLKQGDFLYAGMDLVDSEQGLIEITNLGEDTRIARMMKNAEIARNGKTNIERTADRVAKILLWVVTFLGACVFVAFAWKGEVSVGIHRFVTLLIVTCPCALALATPLVFSLSSRRLLDKGILVKDPEALDALQNIHNIYFDKTGTLTFGQLELDANSLLALEKLDPEQINVLNSMTQKSPHPVSKAMARAIRKIHPNAGVLALDSYQEKAGHGISGIHHGTHYRFERGHSGNIFTAQPVMRSQQCVLGTFSFTDQIRPEAISVIQKLHSAGLKLTVLTGDNEENAKKVLKPILPYVQVLSKLTPEEKAIHARDGIMIGDGVNDSLSLATAKVSIAVQGGIEAAIQSAQIYFLKPNLKLILEVLLQGKKVHTSLMTNFAISTAYNALGASLALTGILHPLIAAIAMPASALSVFGFTVRKFKKGALK